MDGDRKRRACVSCAVGECWLAKPEQRSTKHATARHSTHSTAQHATAQHAPRVGRLRLVGRRQAVCHHERRAGRQCDGGGFQRRLEVYEHGAAGLRLVGCFGRLFWLFRGLRPTCVQLFAVHIQEEVRLQTSWYSRPSPSPAPSAKWPGPSRRPSCPPASRTWRRWEQRLAAGWRSGGIMDCDAARGYLRTLCFSTVVSCKHHSSNSRPSKNSPARPCRRHPPPRQVGHRARCRLQPPEGQQRERRGHH